MPAVLLDRSSQLNEPSVRRYNKDGVTLYEVGKMVYISSADTVGLASNSTPQEAIGMIRKVLDNFVYVQFTGTIDLTGYRTLTAGSEYFLHTLGNITTTAPTGNGTYVQSVGYAESTTRFIIDIKDYLEN